ncbi:unnamed protein product [Bursaphelenchus xylophilus]|uniref:(pine wood nematode) hypothetical protein n=1 Tax=Bursaphelenchus xylophilus TaxID=6326 RepID=A0A1I7RL76_BURXY|nr:unnamed protein product [Bursaphelenchus xylophilus]CAG9083347.1 unnamed protein product [Bursaphelenchus xylophilus]
MRIFNGSELVFSQTYFPSQSNKVLEVKTDSTVRTLALTEVPETGGSFSFPPDAIGFNNRIIFWRTESSRLYLNEVNATRQYQDSSLYIDFAPSVIVQGTSLLLCRDLLLLVVPTQSCIHRFKIRLTGKNSVDQSFTNRSVLSFFPKQEHLQSCHDCHYFSNSVIASSVHVTLDKIGNTYCSIVANKNQLILLNMKIQPSSKSGFEETILKEGYVINRLWNSSEQESTILSSTSIMSADELYVLSVHEDGRLKIWAVNSNSVKNSYNLASFLKQESTVEVESVQMKFSRAFDKHFLVMKVQMVRRTKFLFFEFNAGDLSLRRRVDLEATSVVDFLVTQSSLRRQEFALWVCNRESFEDGTPSGMFQPYSMRKCFVSMNGDFESIWDSIETTAINTKKIDMINHSKIDAIKKRVLGGETYSFEMVERAIQTLCKSPGVKFEYMDWPSLSNYVDGFIGSGQFKTLYLSKEDQHTFSATNNLDEDGVKAAKKKFWTTLDKYCSQFQEQLISPIVLWHCPVLGLVGCIQHARFTVYLEPDHTMKGFVQHDKQVLLKLLKVTEGFLEESCDFRGVLASDLEFLISHLNVLFNVLKWFTERCPDGNADEMVPIKAEYINSSFSIGFMSAALRHRILNRLLFAKCICTLVSLTESHLDKAGKSSDIAWKVSNSRKPINQIRDFYYNLYQSLSTRFFSPYDPSTSAVSLNLAEAFYKSAHLLPNVPPVDEDFDVEDELWNQEQSAKAVTSQFLEFTMNAVHLTIVSLWPNSTTMSFPKFLARNMFYEHLRNYCELNEPYLSNLTYAFNFYKGIALSGLGLPQDADLAFQEALQGIDLGDEALNRALCYYSLKKYPYKHNLCDFYAATMSIFKTSNHGEYVVRSGQLAIKSAEKVGNIKPDPDLMSLIYNKMFSQYVADKKFNEAVKTLHNNPVPSQQLSCLRSLIGTLLDLNEMKILINLPYITLGDKVAEMLESRCKVQNALTENGLFNTVYAFYIKRFEYKKAAQILYSLVWKLKFVSQNRDVLEKRCRLLACVNQTMELLGDDKASLEIDVATVIAHDAIEEDIPENLPKKKFQMTKQDILEEFMLLEARLALCDTEAYDQGPPVDKVDVFNGVITHKNYDLAFVLHRTFGLPVTDLIRSLTLECLQLGFEEPRVTPIWVVHNRRFVDNLRCQTKLPQHWRVLITYVDLSLASLQSTQDDSFVLRNILQIFLERGLEVPEWLSTRYLKVNVRDFLAELIEFDEILLALMTVSSYLENLISARPKLEQLHNIPFVLINNLLIFADKQNTSKIIEESKKTQDALRRVARAFKFIQSV